MINKRAVQMLCQKLCKFLSSRMHYHSHFTDDETGMQRSSGASQFWIQTHVFSPQVPPTLLHVGIQVYISNQRFSAFPACVTTSSAFQGSHISNFPDFTQGSLTRKAERRPCPHLHPSAGRPIRFRGGRVPASHSPEFLNYPPGHLRSTDSIKLIDTGQVT